MKHTQVDWKLLSVSPAFSGMNIVQRQAEPARHRKLAMLFLLPALNSNTNTQNNSGDLLLLP